MASFQTSDASFFGQSWAETTPLSEWETAPAEAWSGSGAGTADVTQMTTTHRALMSNVAPTIVQEDHLHPRVSLRFANFRFMAHIKERHLMRALTSIVLHPPPEIRFKAFPQPLLP